MQHTHTHTQTHTHTHTHTHMCVHPPTHTHTHTHIHMHAIASTGMHTHTQSSTHSRHIILVPYAHTLIQSYEFHKTTSSPFCTRNPCRLCAWPQHCCLAILLCRKTSSYCLLIPQSLSLWEQERARLWTPALAVYVVYWVAWFWAFLPLLCTPYSVVKEIHINCQSAKNSGIVTVQVCCICGEKKK